MSEPAMLLYVVLAVAATVLLASVAYLVFAPPSGASPRGEEPAPAPAPPAEAPHASLVPLASGAEPFEEEEITIVKIRLDDPAFADVDEEDEEEVARDAEARTVPIVADSGADEDEPTRTSVAILVSASGQTDRGHKRKRNEDRFLRMDSHGVYAVADGMGGHAGGDIASQTAVETIERAFRERSFEGNVRGELPRRADELARTIQMANMAILRRSRAEPHLKGMGTTLVAGRFALRKERLYLGHVGDSRCYRIRSGTIRQLTTDHTLGALGLDGPNAPMLSRAVGVRAEVTIDMIIAKPVPGDIYLLCSDGLTKMVEEDDEIRDVILRHENLGLAAQKLIDLANDRGGRDNCTVVLVAVRNAGDMVLPD